MMTVWECRYCGERRALSGDTPIRLSNYLSDDAPLSTSEPIAHLYVCPRPSCQWRWFRQSALERLSQDLWRREEAKFLQDGRGVPGFFPPPPALTPKHIPHSRLIWPTDRALIDELNHWQQVDGWQPPSGR